MTIFQTLINNITLIVTLSIIYNFIVRRCGYRSRTHQVGSGLLFGTVAIIGMLNPLIMMPGLIFDGRSIIISVAGFIGGPLTAVIAASIGTGYRIWLGGPGVIMGVSVILSSAAIGTAYHFLRRRRPVLSRPLHLLGFGIVVHLCMVALIMTLPSNIKFDVLKEMAPFILTLYPLGTLLVCLVLLEQESRILAERNLKESEKTYRSIYENAVEGIFQSTPDGRYVSVNPALARICGYASPEEMIACVTDIATQIFVNPEDRETFKERIERDGQINQFEFRLRRKDGSITWVSSNSRCVRDTDGRILFFEGLIEDISIRKQAEGILERYQLLSGQARDLVLFVRSRDGRIIEANQAAERAYGYSRGELLSMNSAAICPNDPRDRAVEETAEAEREGVLYETVHRRKDGPPFPVEVSSRVALIDGDRILLRIARDISGRKKSEQALAESEERYRTILEEIEDGYQEVDLEGNFTFFNESFRKIFGYGRSEMMGTNYREYAADEANAKKVYRVYNQMYRTGHPVKKYEWDIVTKDGVRRTVEFYASLLRDPEGHPKGFRGIVRDVTERHLSEEQYRVVANGAQAGVYIVQDGRIRYANPHIPRYSGYAEEDLMGAPILSFVHPDDREMVRGKAKQMLRGELSAPYGYRIIDKSGQVKWLMETVTPITYRGRQAVLGNTMDITEQKGAEAERQYLESQLIQSQKMEAIGTLAGGIAHDFNNLLMGIQGYASLMLLGMDEDHRFYEKLKAIETQVRSGADLTRQLLGFARGGRFEVKPTSLNDLINKTITLFGRTKKEIRIQGKYAESLWSVDADRGQIEQVLLNLLVNAWQAMPGGGELSIETENVVLDESYTAPHGIQPGSYVKVSVTDTGVGMDEKTRQRIFDPFFTTKEMGRGTGMGLASVYGIIKGHDGMITVNSEKGRGTTFHIFLPASRKAIMAEAPSFKEIHRGRETILIVDDEAMVTAVTKEMLTELGYRVLVAGSGPEALDIYGPNHEHIDLVILDMVMPGMGGGETFDALKSINPEIKVILSSGYSISGQAKAILERGVAAFLQKPFRIVDLSQRIRETLGDAG